MLQGAKDKEKKKQDKKRRKAKRAAARGVGADEEASSGSDDDAGGKAKGDVAAAEDEDWDPRKAGGPHSEFEKLQKVRDDANGSYTSKTMHMLQKVRDANDDTSKTMSQASESA